MSKFYTPIVVDLAAVKAKLPAGCYFGGVRFDPASGRIDLLWENCAFTSGRDFHVEFPLSDLAAGKVPADVKRTPPETVPAEPKLTAQEPHEPVVGEPKAPVKRSKAK